MGFSINFKPEVDEPYSEWSGYEDTFGPPVERHYGARGGESLAKIERHLGYRAARPDSTPMVLSPINDQIALSGLSEAAITHAQEQVIGLTHELAESMDEMSKVTLL